VVESGEVVRACSKAYLHTSTGCGLSNCQLASEQERMTQRGVDNVNAESSALRDSRHGHERASRVGGMIRVGVKPGQWDWSFDELVATWRRRRAAPIADIEESCGVRRDLGRSRSAMPCL